MRETKTNRRKNSNLKLNLLVFMAAAVIFGLIAFQVGHQIAAGLESQPATVVQVSNPAPAAATSIATAGASSAPPNNSSSAVVSNATQTPAATATSTPAATATPTPAATATPTPTQASASNGSTSTNGSQSNSGSSNSNRRGVPPVRTGGS